MEENNAHISKEIMLNQNMDGFLHLMADWFSKLEGSFRTADVEFKTNIKELSVVLFWGKKDNCTPTIRIMTDRFHWFSNLENSRMNTCHSKDILLPISLCIHKILQMFSFMNKILKFNLTTVQTSYEYISYWNSLNPNTRPTVYSRVKRIHLLMLNKNRNESVVIGDNIWM